MSPTKWSELKEKRSRTSGARVGYLRARNAYRLAQRVRLLREARGITQGELAARTESPELTIDTDRLAIEESVAAVLEYVDRNFRKTA